MHDEPDETTPLGTRPIETTQTEDRISESPARDAKPVVLFVDDEERVVRLLKIMFRGHYEVHTAPSAREALAILESTPVDVVVSDQRMPDVTGIELLSQVRQRWPATVRLLLTGYSDLVAIIGAVNEGEVHRFLGKPWSQADLRGAIAEAAEIALSNRRSQRNMQPIWRGDTKGTQFSIASQLLAIEGCDADRLEIMEMFSRDFQVHPATSIKEAIEVIARQEIGVIVTSTAVDGTDISALLGEIARIDPAITTVAMTSAPQSDTVIRLINSGRIYRFAIKPLSPNLFRLAVNAAMREHHRRLADPRVVKRRMQREAEDGIETGEAFVATLMKRLNQFET
ncbi:response regulator [Agrobacterium vitis]|uniref:response regulator n=1 Tax=Agrobacterium vitis TaxID=373 RepID=UPI003D2B6479